MTRKINQSVKTNNNLHLTQEDLHLLNSKSGMSLMLKSDNIDLPKILEQLKIQEEILKFQEELLLMQNWVIENKKKVVILFEGRDASGKGGAIRKITEYLNPRHYNIVALNKPNESESLQWYFQRYVSYLPKPSEIVFFDRSWYNRAVLEPVHNFCTPQQYDIFMSQVNDFEKMILSSDTYLVKLYFSISKNEQKLRLDKLANDPLRHWKISSLDQKAQRLWNSYTKYKELMFKKTNTKLSPWQKIDANNKFQARLEAIKIVLSLIPYKSSVENVTNSSKAPRKKLLSK